MDVSLSELRDAVGPLCERRARARFDALAGLKGGSGAPEPSPFAHPEVFAYLTEQATSAKRSDAAKRKLRLLRAFAAAEHERAQNARADEELSRGLSEPLHSGLEALSFSSARALAATHASRERRDVTERALAERLGKLRSPLARRVEGALETAERLGKGQGYLAFSEDVLGLPLSKLGEEADATLAATSDAFLDVLGFALKREDATVRPRPSGIARRHDLSRALSVPKLDGVYAKEEERLSALKVLSDLGLEPSRERPLRLDDERREGKTTEPCAVALAVPSDVRVLFTEEAGLRQYAALYRALGASSAFVGRKEDLPVEYRWFGDRAVPLACASLFEGLLGDEGFLRKLLRAPVKEARDGRQASAMFRLARLRGDLAMLRFELELYGRGPTKAADDAYVERLSEALHVNVRPEFGLFERSERFDVANRLRGEALGRLLSKTLTERFNEDWYRNPSAGAYLRTLFARGGEPTAEELAQELSGELSVRAVGDALCRALE